MAISRGDLSVPPLDDSERRWLARLERVLRDMPKRLRLVECADSMLLVDRKASHHTEMHDGGARAAGIVLADVEHSFGKCTSVSG